MILRYGLEADTGSFYGRYWECAGITIGFCDRCRLRFVCYTNGIVQQITNQTVCPEDEVKILKQLSGISSDVLVMNTNWGRPMKEGVKHNGSAAVL